MAAAKPRVHARLQPLPVLCVSERERVAWARSADLHDEAPILGEHFDIVVGLSSYNARERCASSSDMPSSAMRRSLADNG